MVRVAKRSPKLFDPKATPEQRQAAVLSMLKGLAQDQHPILLGPFRSELGFEVSYWLPFVSWMASQVPNFDKRAVVVSRGGMAPLYERMANRGVDLYALRSVKEVRRENLFDQQVTQLQKQIRPTDWDEAVLDDAAKVMKLTPPFHVVHPAWMYWALAPYWEEQRGLAYLGSMTKYDPVPAPKLQGTLPERFVAVKFYGRATFPYPHPEIAQVVPQIVGNIASQVPVVLLSSGDEHDDHNDIPIAGQNIVSLPSVPAEQSIAVQAAVLSKAVAFVGTYGGVQQMALRLGVPSVGLYLKWGGTAHAHLMLSSWLSKVGNVPFVAGSITDLDIVRQCVSAPMKGAA